MRLIKHNRIIHLQIQEGKLLPYGYIDNSTVRWVPVDDFKITDPGVRSGKDYHTMTYEQRDLLLDELTPHESDHIVTGMGFYKFINCISNIMQKMNKNGKIVQLENLYFLFQYVSKNKIILSFKNHQESIHKINLQCFFLRNYCQLNFFLSIKIDIKRIFKIWR